MIGKTNLEYFHHLEPGEIRTPISGSADTSSVTYTSLQHSNGGGVQKVDDDPLWADESAGEPQEVHR